MEDLTYHLEGILKTKDDIQDFEGPLTLILMLLQPLCEIRYDKKITAPITAAATKLSRTSCIVSAPVLVTK